MNKKEPEPHPEIGGWSEFCAPGVSAEDLGISLSNGITLHIIKFTPPGKENPFPVVMLPGLVSVIDSFRHLVFELARHFTVYWVETREKSSSMVTVEAKFDVASIGSDLPELIFLLGLEEKHYILFGASLSGTAILDQYSNINLKPYSLVLLEPNAVFDYPAWGLWLIRVSIRADRIGSWMAGGADPDLQDSGMLKRLAKWYLRNIRINVKEDYEMYLISCRALDAASPYKLKRTILAISSYRLWDRMGEIDTPTLMICASRDTLHRHNDILKISGMISDCTLIDLESHDRTNGKECADLLREYLMKA